MERTYVQIDCDIYSSSIYLEYPVKGSVWGTYIVGDSYIINGAFPMRMIDCNHVDLCQLCIV